MADVTTPPSAALQAAQARVAKLAALGDKAPKLQEVVAFGPGAVERWQWANGVQLLLAADAQAPVVAVHSWLAVGSADEPPGQTGLAHLLEHLMFKATATQPAGSFDRLLEGHGASANAATWLDWTMYHQVVPATVVPQVLQLEADRLVHLKLSANAVKSELEVVKNERREVVDSDPDGQVAEALAKLVYGAHPYGHPTVGWAADLETATKDTVIAFYKARYAAANLTLVVAGGFDPEAVLTAVANQYAALPAVTVPARVVPPKLAPSPVRQMAMTLDAHASWVAMAWPTVALGHRDHMALAVLAEALCGADSARWHKLLVDDKQVASDVRCHQSELRLTGALELHATLRPGKTAAEALAVLDAAAAALVGAEPLQETEIAAAKNRMKTDVWRELASVDGRADVLGRAWATTGQLQSATQWAELVAAQSAATVNAAAKTWCKANERRAVLADPAPPASARKRGNRAVAVAGPR